MWTPRYLPGGVLRCLVSLCGSQGTLGGSDGSWSLPRRGPASPSSAVEPGMAHAKGWKPPALCVTALGLPGELPELSQLCKGGHCPAPNPVPPGSLCFWSASSLSWLPSRLGVHPSAPGWFLCQWPAEPRWFCQWPMVWAIHPGHFSPSQPSRSLSSTNKHVKIWNR